MEIDADIFKKATGTEPEHDDLERSNCKQAGQIGHYHCGWNSLLNRPNFMCPSSAIEVDRCAAALLAGDLAEQRRIHDSYATFGSTAS